MVTVFSPTAEDDIIDPVSVMLHRLPVVVLGTLAVPYSDDTVSSSRIEPAEVWIVLKGVDPRSVVPLHFISYDEGDLDIAKTKHRK